MTLIDTSGGVVRGDRRWWSADADDLSRSVFDAAYFVDDQTLDRQQRALRAYCLYGDTANLGGSIERVITNRMRRNVIASAVDTATSEVTQTQPRPMFVSIGGSWLDGKRAEKLMAACDAKFLQWEMRLRGPQIYRDGLIAGAGVGHVYIDSHGKKSRVSFERIFPLHLLVDDVGCTDVEPRTIYLRRYVDRWYLAQRYPEHAETIEHAAAPDFRYGFAPDPRADVVEVLSLIHI